MGKMFLQDGGKYFWFMLLSKFDGLVYEEQCYASFNGVYFISKLDSLFSFERLTAVKKSMLNRIISWLSGLEFFLIKITGVQNALGVTHHISRTKSEENV